MKALSLIMGCSAILATALFSQTPSTSQLLAEDDVEGRAIFAMKEFDDSSLVRKHGWTYVAKDLYPKAVELQKARMAADEIRVKEWMAKGLSRENALIAVADENNAKKQTAKLAKAMSEQTKVQRDQLDETRRTNDELNRIEFNRMMENMRREEARQRAAANR